MARNGKRRLLAEMNVVPYIDVMLVLVVILMVAAPYVNPSIVSVSLYGRIDADRRKSGSGCHCCG